MPDLAFPERTSAFPFAGSTMLYEGDPMKSTELRNPRRRTLLKAAAGLGGVRLGA